MRNVPCAMPASTRGPVARRRHLPSCATSQSRREITGTLEADTPAWKPMLNAIHPRVLVISHRAFNDKGASGNALASYFKHWDPDALAELYFYAELPCGPMS